MKIRPLHRQLELEFAAPACIVFLDLFLHIPQQLFIALGLRIDPSGPFGAEVEAEQPALTVDPGGETAKPGLDRSPISLRVGHAASLRLAHKWQVARLLCGAKVCINACTASGPGRSSKTCRR